MVRFSRFIASLVIICTAGLGMPLPANAGVIGTDRVVASADRERLAGSLAREDVRAQLESFGVSPDDVQARLDAMSEDEIAQLAGQVDNLPAGGNGIIGAIVFVFVLLLVTDLLGLTKVFPFTRSVR